MNVYDLFPTRFIAASDLNGKSFTLTIRSVTLEDMQSHEQKTVTKPCLWFSNATKGMVLNKTNTMIIAGMYGPETDAWAGKQIVIYATKVRAFGKLEEAVRVREEVPPPPTPRPAAKAAQVEESAGLDDVEDVTDFDGTDSLDITIDPDTGEILSADKSLWEPNAPVSSAPNRLSPAQMTKLHTLGASVHGKRWEAERPALVSEVSDGACTSCKELTPEQATVLITLLEMELKRARNGKVTA